ncbi:glycosyltransferase family 2 protein [uncultured Fibrobacter sp.]|uniref:glycosyltransferase family 2 protein n=1 Tax=uncultured Fibrobacter sp. TaxID=261512 RepID=UPI0025FA78D3|nr:glycosyltransferase family 2 protein [uncultured Fibrobacter sp.]
MERNNYKIAVLLATYNGGKYIKEQLESLFQQSCKQFHLYVRDDGSSDDTMKIVEEFRQKYPDKITILEDSQKHRGAAKSFMYLLENVDSEYYMFCDQDDIWLPEKIEKTYARMKEIETATLSETAAHVKGNAPILVATDLRVVDKQLSPIKESFNEDLKIDVFRKHPELICVRHVVTGCTMMFNRAAKLAALPMSPRATMHDEWVALCVHFKGGVISILDDATMLYRQHTSNTLGADQARKGFFARAIARAGQKQFFQVAKLLHKDFGLSYLKFLMYKILYSWF